MRSGSREDADERPKSLSYRHTRRGRRELREGHLSRLDATIAEWKEGSERIGAVTAVEVAAVAARRNALQRLLTEDRFGDLQKQVPAEMSFLRLDLQKRLEKARAADVEARQALRRSSRTARMLLEELDKNGRSVPDNLRCVLGSEHQTAADLERAIKNAFDLLSPSSETTGATDRQRAIADQLGQGERRRTLADWIAARPPTADDAFSIRIDQHLAELSALGIEIAPFEAGSAAIFGEMSRHRRTLLADSLMVELATALKSGRERASRFADLRERRAELSNLKSEEASTLRSMIDAALSRHDAV